MSRKKRDVIARFEEHSLALFAALVMGMSAGAHAQNSSGDMSGGSMLQAQATMGPSQPSPAAKRAHLDAVFARSDTDKDGRLSRDESVRLPAVHERFDEIDANKDNFLSRAEFDKGVEN